MRLTEDGVRVNGSGVWASPLLPLTVVGCSAISGAFEG